MSIWDDPELKVGGDYVTFDAPGDTISGTVQAIRAHRFAPGEAAVPQVLLVCDDGEERTVTAGQIRLKLALAEQRPEAGDHVRITLTDVEKRQGGKTLKHFDLVVTRGNGTVPTATPAAAPAAPAAPAPVAAAAPADPAAIAAAMAALTPEQRLSMGLPAA